MRGACGQGEFGGRISFADLGGRQSSFTCDRTEFLGRNGTPEHPAALESDRRTVGKARRGSRSVRRIADRDRTAPRRERRTRFLLGQAENQEQRVQAVLVAIAQPTWTRCCDEVTRQWDDILGAVQVTTPDPSMDLLLNRWLLYQTLSCRIWARAAFYQLSGAYGFRDQLQDVMALTVAKRSVAREHLLRSAGRQFVEGDVQHWWHPPSGRGIRTRMSDDLLWLPYAVIQFIEATGDIDRAGRNRSRSSRATRLPKDRTNRTSSRAFRKHVPRFSNIARAHSIAASTVGEHGLPLMGTGDWNDGMNRVGQQGKGESVWLGWFLHTILWEFAKIADARGERKRAETWRLHVSALKAALERDGWDGEWYRRAYYDDGTPLGSATGHGMPNRLDRSILGSHQRRRGTGARGTAQWRRSIEHLIRRADGLILLLDAAVRSHIDTIPATSRATFPESAKTAASIRMPRSGR